MNDTSMQLRDTTADPAPLGLLGFGLTTVLLNLHNAGLYELNSMILAMGLCYGGAAQIVAGLMEWKKGNTFGTTAFLSYGFFWWSLVLLVLLPKWGIATATNEESMAAYLAIWGVFTLVMFVGTFHLSRALQIVFGPSSVARENGHRPFWRRRSCHLKKPSVRSKRSEPPGTRRDRRRWG